MENKELEKAILTIKNYCKSREHCYECEIRDNCEDYPYDWEIEQ